MRFLIYDVAPKKRLFYGLIGRKKQAFYLANRLSKTFMPYFKPGVLVDFEVTGKTRQVGQVKAYVVHHFNEVVQLSPKTVFYNLKTMRQTMYHVLKQYQHFMFLDCEMTMPSYQKGKHIPEIIQVGYVVSNKKGDIILSDDFFVKPVLKDAINHRTRKFLNLDEDNFWQTAIPYENFYHKLEDIINTYQPQIVVWGKNDIQALKQGYELHQKAPITNDKLFIDLLRLHKDYFNLQDDLGLFKAYQTYYRHQVNQQHDAKDDALVTKDVFDGFMEQIRLLSK